MVRKRKQYKQTIMHYSGSTPDPSRTAPRAALRCRFARRPAVLAARLCERFQLPLRKTVFLRHLYLKTNSLPRQARDKHRENFKKMRFFAPSYSTPAAIPKTDGWQLYSLADVLVKQ